jgi:hypothetical protein
MKKYVVKNGRFPVVLVASFFLFILAGFLYSKPFKILKEVVAVGGTSVGQINLNLSGTTYVPGGVWKPDGSVGIGNTNPQTKFDVTGTGRFSSTLTATSGLTLSAGTLSLPANSITDAMVSDTLTASTATTATTATNQSGGTVNATTGAFSGNVTFPGSGIWNSSGNVGIGTTGPNEKLSVSGNILANTYAYISSEASGTDSVYGYNAIGTGSSGNLKTGPVNASSVHPQAIVMGPSEGIRFLTSSAWPGISTDFAISTYERMRINPSGNVGIGTTAPSAKLTVSYDGINNYADIAGGNVTFTTNTNSATVLTIKGTGTADLLNVLDNTTEVLTILDGGNVGIGTTAPGYKLDVSGNARITTNLGVGTTPNDNYAINAAGGTYGIWATGSTMGGRFVDSNGTSTTYAAYGGWGIYTVQNGYFGGNVGIGTTDPGSYKLNVNGNTYMGGTVTFATNIVTGPYYACVDSNGTIGAYTSCSSSDARLKTNIDDISHQRDVLSDLQQLRGVYYNWDSENPANKGKGLRREVGMIAQEVEKVLPELVSMGTDGYRTLNYHQYTGFLTEVAKAQQTQIVSLKSVMTDFIGKFKEGLIETKKLIVDGVDILKKFNELSVKVESQQKQIEELKSTVEELKK